MVAATDTARSATGARVVVSGASCTWASVPASSSTKFPGRAHGRPKTQARRKPPVPSTSRHRRRSASVAVDVARERCAARALLPPRTSAHVPPAPDRAPPRAPTGRSSNVRSTVRARQPRPASASSALLRLGGTPTDHDRHAQHLPADPVRARDLQRRPHRAPAPVAGCARHRAGGRRARAGDRSGRGGPVGERLGRQRRCGGAAAQRVRRGGDPARVRHLRRARRGRRAGHRRRADRADDRGAAHRAPGPDGTPAAHPGAAARRGRRRGDDDRDRGPAGWSRATAPTRRGSP